MKTILISLSVLALLGCGTKKISGDGTGQTIEMKAEKKLTASIGRIELGNPVKITSARIDGNKLIVGISYSGGCSEHQFKLVGSENIAKSLPPIRSVSLVHTTDTPDNCKALIMKTLEFDIKNLAYEQKEGSVIILDLEGWDEKMRYTFE